MTNNIGNDMKSFNQQLFSMDIEDLKLTKDLISDLIKNKIKSTLKVGMNVFIVQKTKKTPGVITKINMKKCLVKSGMTTYQVPMSMLEVA
jgi:uncharacterized protein YwbE